MHVRWLDGGEMRARLALQAPRPAAAATRGITLLELVIAIFVLSIGTIAAFRTIDYAGHAIGGEASRLFAYQVALNRAEELRLVGAIAGRNLPRQVDYGPYRWDISAQEEKTAANLVEITLVVRAKDQPGALLVVYVRPEASTTASSTANTGDSK